MKSLVQATVISLLTTVMFSGQAQAATFYAESGDAGNTLAGAQNIPSTGPAGSVIPDSLQLNGSFDVPSDVDMYKLSLTGSGTFSAEVLSSGTTVSDTRLSLFDFAGHGIYANDDIDNANGNLLSRLPKGGLSPATSGIYYLAITTYDNDALNSSNNTIFDLSTSPSAVVGPSGSGTTATLDHWASPSSGNGEIGAYTVKLTGVEVAAPSQSLPVPEPSSVLSLLAFGAFAIVSQLRNQLKH